MISKITNWIDGKLETCTAAEEPLLRELIEFIITEMQKEAAEMREEMREAMREARDD